MNFLVLGKIVTAAAQEAVESIHSAPQSRSAQVREFLLT